MDFRLIKKILDAKSIDDVRDIITSDIASSRKSLTLFKLINEYGLNVWDFIEYIEPGSPHKLRKLLFESENVDWNYKNSQGQGLFFYITTSDEMVECIKNGVSYDYPGHNVIEYYIESNKVSLATLKAFMEEVGDTLKHVSLKNLSVLSHASNPKFNYMVEYWKKLVKSPSRFLHTLINHSIDQPKAIAWVTRVFPHIANRPRYHYLNMAMHESVRLFLPCRSYNSIYSIIRLNYILLFVNRPILYNYLLTLVEDSNAIEIFPWIARVKKVPTLRTMCIASAFENNVKIPSWYPEPLYTRKCACGDLEPNHPLMLANGAPVQESKKVINGKVRKIRSTVVDINITRQEVNAWIDLQRVQ